MTFLLIRPDSWNFPLFVHVAGAMAVTAALFIAVGSLALAWRASGEERAAITRFGFRTLLYGGIPAYLVMRIGAEWIYSKEYSGDNDPGWVGFGYLTADLGGILILISTILAGLGARRLRSGGGGGGLAKASTVLATLVVALYVIAVWAMTTKPS